MSPCQELFLGFVLFNTLLKMVVHFGVYRKKCKQHFITDNILTSVVYQEITNKTNMTVSAGGRGATKKNHDIISLYTTTHSTQTTYRSVKVDSPAHARTTHRGLPQKRLEKRSLLNHPSCPPDEPIGQGTELN